MLFTVVSPRHGEMLNAYAFRIESAVYETRIATACGGALEATCEIFNAPLQEVAPSGPQEVLISRISVLSHSCHYDCITAHEQVE